jgi:hypothetical protein
VRWAESVDIEAPAERVLPALADKRQVVAWSAATGFACEIDGDGTSVGSSMVMRDASGREQGRQRLAAVGAHRLECRLSNRGSRGADDDAGGRRPRGAAGGRAHPGAPGLPGHPAPSRNRCAPLRKLVVARRVRASHVEDLRLLKGHVKGSARRHPRRPRTHEPGPCAGPPLRSRPARGVGGGRGSQAARTRRVFNATRPGGLDGWTMYLEQYELMRAHIMDVLEQQAGADGTVLSVLVDTAQERYGARAGTDTRLHGTRRHARRHGLSHAAASRPNWPCPAWSMQGPSHAG